MRLYEVLENDRWKLISVKRPVKISQSSDDNSGGDDSGGNTVVISVEYLTKFLVDKEEKKMIIDHQSPDGKHISELGDFSFFTEMVDKNVGKSLGSGWETISALDVKETKVLSDWLESHKDVYTVEEDDEDLVLNEPPQETSDEGRSAADIEYVDIDVPTGANLVNNDFSLGVKKKEKDEEKESPSATPTKTPTRVKDVSAR
jgi:hypothetical protein